MDALRAEFTSAEDVDSFDVDGAADMEDGVLLRRGRFAGGRSGGPTEGEAEGVNSVRWGSVMKRLLGAPLGAGGDIVAVAARDERAMVLVRGMLLTTVTNSKPINASRQAGIAKTGSVASQPGPLLSPSSTLFSGNVIIEARETLVRCNVHMVCTFYHVLDGYSNVVSVRVTQKLVHDRVGMKTTPLIQPINKQDCAK